MICTAPQSDFELQRHGRVLPRAASLRAKRSDPAFRNDLDCFVAALLAMTFYGIRIDEPVVSRPSSSRCAFCASLSGYFWLIGIFTAPEPTTLKRSLAISMRSCRFAV